MRPAEREFDGVCVCVCMCVCAGVCVSVCASVCQRRDAHAGRGWHTLLVLLMPCVHDPPLPLPFTAYVTPTPTPTPPARHTRACLLQLSFQAPAALSHFVQQY